MENGKWKMENGKFNSIEFEILFINRISKMKKVLELNSKNL